LATADIVILAIVLLSALIGLARGLFKEVLSLATWAAAVGLGVFFAQEAAGYLTGIIEDDMIRLVAAFGGIFIGTLIAGGLVQWLIGKLVETTGLTGSDRLLGFLFGAVRGVLVCLVGLIAIKAFAQTADWWEASRLIPALLAFEHDLLDVFGESTEWLSAAGSGE
jgi:membrane protein required for colicin V production